MSSTIPRGYLEINSALSRLNTEVNLMGVVTDFRPPCTSRGTDLMFSFSIADSSYGGAYDDGLLIRFFRPLQSEMPAIRGTGDVVLLRGLKIKEWSGMTIGLSTWGTSWVVFPAESIPVKAPSSAVQLKNVKDARGLAPNLSEMLYAISLCNSRDRSTFTASSSPPTVSALTPVLSAPSTAQRKDKFSLIKDVNVDTFYNLVGQVVRLYPTNDRVELYVTDYTWNPLLWHNPEPDDGSGSGQEGDEYHYTGSNSVQKKKKGPYGKMTLTVTLWGNNAYFCRQQIKEDDFVHLRNVHIKFSNDAKVEGALHSDRRYPDRIDVTVLKNNKDDDRVKDVLRRKRDYWKKFNNKADDFAHQNKALKRKSMEDDKTLSKNQVRKKRKREREQLSRSKDQGEGDQSDKENDVGENRVRHSKRKQTLDQRSPPPQKQELNSSVRCAHHLKPPRPVSSIISLDKHTNHPPNGAPYTLPFQNINSRATVRVIDFFPPNLVDFAVPLPRASEYAILSEDECSESASDRHGDDLDDRSEAEDVQWEWRFGLVLEDALGGRHQEKSSIEVFVTGQDAEGLLKLEAEDLRKSPDALDTLREKLFLLWGDLEERKVSNRTALERVDGNSASPSTVEAPRMKPFQCCLKEYGVKKRMQRSTNEKSNESEDESGYERRQDRNDWVWERRWRMFGCTIS